MIYTRKNIISSLILLQNEIDSLHDDVPEELKERILNKLYEKIKEQIKILNKLSDKELIEMFNKQNSVKLRIFSDGKFFIQDDIVRFSCQVH